MIDWTQIHDRLVRSGLSPDNAWDALSKTYIGFVEGSVESQSEAQAAEYLFQTAKMWAFCWKVRPTLIEKAVQAKDNILDAANERGEGIAEDEIFVAPIEHDEADYIADLLGGVPQTYRVPTLVVISALFKRPPTKPLTVEACRKLLQKAGVGNTTEYARQVYTFLTTLRNTNAV